MIHLIKEIKSISPFYLTLLYDNGEILKIDLKNKLEEWSKSKGSKFKPLLDPDYFKKVKYHKEFQSVYWDNGIDLCPDFLYSLGQPFF